MANGADYKQRQISVIGFYYWNFWNIWGTELFSLMPIAVMVSVELYETTPNFLGCI